MIAVVAAKVWGGGYYFLHSTVGVPSQHFLVDPLNTNGVTLLDPPSRNMCFFYLHLHLSFAHITQHFVHFEGKAVCLIRDKHHLLDISHLVRHDAPYLFQKYVKESHGKDVRVVIVGEQVIGSMLRCSTDGRMQSNCCLGKCTYRDR